MGLKIPCSKERVGSTPTSGTIKRETMSKSCKCEGNPYTWDKEKNWWTDGFFAIEFDAEFVVISQVVKGEKQCEIAIVQNDNFEFICPGCEATLKSGGEIEVTDYEECARIIAERFNLPIELTRLDDIQGNRDN